MVKVSQSIFTTNFEKNYAYASDRGDLVFFIRQCQRLMAHWRAVLPPDRFIEVDYEALVADPEPNARRLIGACGLEWDDASASQQANDQHRKPLAGAPADLPHVGRTMAAV